MASFGGTWLKRSAQKVTHNIGILFKPGVLIGGNTGDTFVLGVKGELGVPVSIDVHERVSVVTGGYVPFTYFINKTFDDRGLVPLLIRMGVEIKANENVAPWARTRARPTPRAPLRASPPESPSSSAG